MGTRLLAQSPRRDSFSASLIADSLAVATTTKNLLFADSSMTELCSIHGEPMERSSVETVGSSVLSIFSKRSVKSIIFIMLLTLQLTTVTVATFAPELPGYQHLRHRYQPHHIPVRWTKSPGAHRGRPVDVMTDVINDLGTRILDRYLDNAGNIGFSPSGLGFVLVALYEGSAGSSSREIEQVLGLPHDRRITRIGLRDIHRRLRSYLNADAFLGGLTLNRDDINLRPEYEDILRFYGFDISDSGVDGGNSTTPLPSDSTTRSAAVSTLADSTGGTTTTEMSTAAVSAVATTMSEAVDIITDMTGGGAGSAMSPSAENSSSLRTDATTGTGSPAMTAVMKIGTITDSNMTNSSTVPSMQRFLGPPEVPSGTIGPIQRLLVPSTILGATTPLIDAGTSSPVSPLVSASMTMANPDETTVDSPTAVETENPTTNLQTGTTMFVEDSTGDNSANNSVRKRRGVPHGFGGYFASFADDGIWLDEFGRSNGHYTSQDEDIVVNPRRPTEVAFLVNGCDYSRVTAASYTAILPFAYFPSLRASLLEFPLDDPRYKILVMLPSESNGTRRLARLLATKPSITLRHLRHSLRPNWITAIIPSFMLRGFATLTPLLQSLGISNVFDPRTADLSPMSPDLGVYARDIQQSIGVNIRNNAKGGVGGADGGNEEQQSTSGNLGRSARGIVARPPFFAADGAISLPTYPHYSSYPGNVLYEKAHPVPFLVDRPFLYFIIDDETSVTLLAGRIDDPLNSRML